MGQQLTPVVKYLLIANAIFFVLTGLIAPVLEQKFALYNIFYSDHFQPYQLFTHFFTHANFRHIFFNMLMLFFFGPLLEQVWGSKRFLNFYLITGVGASVLYISVSSVGLFLHKKELDHFVDNPTLSNYRNYIVEEANEILSDHGKEKANNILNRFEEQPNNPDIQSEAINFCTGLFDGYRNAPNANVRGASGAIFGILMAFMLLFPNTEIYLLFLFPIKAKYLVPGLALFELYSGLSRAPGDNVAHFAHLSGMLIAFILVKIWNKKSDKFY